MMKLPKIAVPIFRNKDKIVFDNKDGTFTAIYKNKVHRYPNDSANYYPDVYGYITDGGACGRTAYDASASGYMGIKGTSQCITDSAPTNYRTYYSADTSDLEGATISDAQFKFVITTITISKLYLPAFDWEVEYCFASDQIGAAIDTSDFGNCGGADKTATTYQTTGTKTVSSVENLINQTGDTDIEVRANQAWYDDADAAGKDYYYTVDIDGCYLAVVYTPAPSATPQLTLMGAGQ